MVGEDPFAELRAELEEPEPEVFKFEESGDELVGTVRSLLQITFRERNKLIWQLVVDSVDGRPFKLMLPGDLEAKLVDEREVRPGDKIAIRLIGVSDKSGFKSFKCAVRPERWRESVPLPAGPSDYDEAPF